MNLPNYFIADLPDSKALTPTILQEACHTLRRNRAQYLAHRTTTDVLKLLAEVGESWLRADYPFRKLALEQGPKFTGFGPVTLSRGLDTLFQHFTMESFRALLEQDLGHPLRLDGMAWTESELKAKRASLACAPELLAHVSGGLIPNSPVMSLALGILTRSAQVLKCATGASFLPRLFAHSLYDADPKLGACIEIAEWAGGTLDLERVLFQEADCITATGTDKTLATIRHRLPIGKRFVGYGHRVSFSFISSSILRPAMVSTLASEAADDIVAWNQLGCLSPHAVYVEQGGASSPEEFAEAVAGALAAREQTEPRGPLGTSAAAVIASRRSFYEVRAAHSQETRLWCSPGSTAWTVVYENDSLFQVSCLNRFIYVKGVKNLTRALEGADSVRQNVSTVGLAAAEDRAPGLAAETALWGASRVCPLGRMQDPPLTWRHDGRPALGDLVMWTDWEQAAHK
jgi:hypothetical protein